MLFIENQWEVKRDLNVAILRSALGYGSAAGSKLLALAFHFSARICYMFLLSTCRGERDLGLCMTSGLAQKKSGCEVLASDWKRVCCRICLNLPLHSRILLQVPKPGTDLNLALLYIVPCLEKSCSAMNLKQKTLPWWQKLRKRWPARCGLGHTYH